LYERTAKKASVNSTKKCQLNFEPGFFVALLFQSKVRSITEGSITAALAHAKKHRA
jgi:hypothetical protein